MRAMRSGTTNAGGKLTEELKTMCAEPLKNAVSSLAVSSGRPVRESMRVMLEMQCFGRLYAVRSAATGTEADPFEAPVVDVDDAIRALACMSGLSTQEYIRQALIEHAFGLVHAQRMAQAAPGSKGAE
ncbi:hypothetical protein [Uliginosibacterium sp. 31-12]|uniref:hypothetical protein n=1 Tax=Uliginosibacterium sp. 31-12 TaxID=3062781 RepID=UPI0026E13A28|nr:hypothetical protein [Uliginosibacterium sp. 31-12]